MGNEGVPKPWQLIERFRRSDAEKRLANQGRLLTALDSLAAEGTTEASGYELARRDAELRHPELRDPSWRMMGHGTIYRELSHLEREGTLSARWETHEDDGGPRRRLYSRPEPLAPTEGPVNPQRT